jgi:sugar lactone lactonase YvrE
MHSHWSDYLPKSVVRTFRLVGFTTLVGLLFAGIGFAQSSSTSTITTYAGPPLPVSGAQAITQAFDFPSSVIADGAGGFYFASYLQHRIYRVDSGGTLSVIAGSGAQGFGGDGGPATSAHLSYPVGVAVDGAGNLFIADLQNNRIRKVSPVGIITTVAGTTFGFSGDGGAATSAQLVHPEGVAVDGAGNLFIADTFNQCIRKVGSDGIITTVAGTGVSGFSGDGGAATSAQLVNPWGVAVDGAGNLFIADSGNNRIRKVTAAGIITTVAGTTLGFSGDGGAATSAQLVNPWGVAVDGAGNLFIADTSNNRIRKVTVDGIITTVAGTGTRGFSGDGGPATSAQLSVPEGVAVDGAGNLFIAEFNNQRIRKVTAAGIITTVAGTGISGFSGDGGPATSARSSSANGVVVDGAGNLFIADGNNRIRKVTAAGIITTVAGTGILGFSGDGGPATSAQLSFPYGVAVDGAGNLFIADTGNNRIRRVTAAGIITTVAGNGVPGYSGDGGPATSAQVPDPLGVAVDGAGNLFIADSEHTVTKFGNSHIRKVTPAGIITTVAGTTFGFSGDGGPATSAQLDGSSGLAVDGAGNLYIADSLNNRIRKVGSDGIITTVAGGGPGGLGDGGPATSAHLFEPSGVAVDGAGNLFIADTGDDRIRKVTVDGVITTVAGSGFREGGFSGFSGDGGAAASAQLNFPYGVALDAAGNLFIADTGNFRIRKVTFTESVSFSITDHGGTSVVSSGTSPVIATGYAAIQANAGSTTPSGVAIYSYRPGSYLVSETGVPATSALSSGRIYAEINGPVNTGLAIVNPNNQTATINFFYTDTGGNDLGSGTTTLAANSQIAKFLDEVSFKTFTGATFQGTFSFTSDVPIAAVAIRSLVNERGDFLMSTLPVIDPTVAANTGTLVVPHFADSGGWTTQILLVNPTSTAMTGNVEFRDEGGGVVNVPITGHSTGAYTVAPRSSQKLVTTGAAPTALTGSVRIIPMSGLLVGGNTPTPLVVFSFKPGTTTLSEAGVPAASGTAFRMYGESSGTASAPGSIQAGIAVTNNAAAGAPVTFELFNPDGSTAGLPAPVSINLPAYGHIAKFLSELFPNPPLPNPFQGVVRMSTTSPSGISVVGLRTRYNELGDFLITTTPPTNEAAPSNTAASFFPQLADGGGYTTQFILFSGRAGQTASGTMQLFTDSGGALNRPLQ